MRRFLSSSSSSPSVAHRKTQEKFISSTNKASLIDSTSLSSLGESTIATDRPLSYPKLKIKKVDHFYSWWSNKWKYRDSGSNVIPESRPLPSEDYDDGWQQFCFVVIREIPQPNKDLETAEQPKPFFVVRVKSPYLRKACKDVIGNSTGIWWNANPLELDPHLLLTFLPSFLVYRDGLSCKEPNSEESFVRATVDVLVDYLRTDYRTTLSSIDNLTSHGKITFEHLFGIFVPGSIVLTNSTTTGGLLALKLISTSETAQGHELRCDSIDVCRDNQNHYGFGKVSRTMWIARFDGTKDITSLNAYPIQYHPHEEEVKRSLIARGRTWAKYSDGQNHHLQYNGTASTKNEGTKWNVNSRVIIDRVNYERYNPGSWIPGPVTRSNQAMPPNNDMAYDSTLDLPPQHNLERRKPQWEIENLTEDDLLQASQVLRGFSLSDKLWMEFNIDHIAPIEWNDEAFSNLVLPPDRKTLLQSLVEAHNMELGFDDFIKGKGQGLVVNLFGPPGVGKTLTAEATSEHVRRPLYVVGAGDLGTSAQELDRQLKEAFELAAAWKAIILIDEADVFLEQRSLHDLKRNAMVAVFLRHLEYYPAILFLTTNRVKAFDEALLSRIHIALHFQDLTTKARAEVWTAFLGKIGVRISSDSGVSAEELEKLAERNINGRQVKNATKTAQYLAASRGEKLRYKHLREVLDVMEQFSADFEGMRRGARNIINTQ